MNIKRTHLSSSSIQNTSTCYQDSSSNKIRRPTRSPWIACLASSIEPWIQKCAINLLRIILFTLIIFTKILQYPAPPLWIQPSTRSVPSLSLYPHIGFVNYHWYSMIIDYWLLSDFIFLLKRSTLWVKKSYINPIVTMMLHHIYWIVFWLDCEILIFM